MSEVLDTFFLFGKNYCATLAMGAVCAYLGLYCVLRRIVFTGVALAQLAAAGVAGAFFLADRNLGGVSRLAASHGATWGSLGMSLAGVMGLELRSKKSGSATPDALVGLAYSASSALAILLVWRSSRGLTELRNILAGEVLLTGEGELLSLWIGLGLVVGLHLVFRKEFLLVSFDAEFARAQGAPEARLQRLLLGSLAVAVAVSLKAGGLLLVFAFLVLPAVAGLTIARRLEEAALYSVLTAAAASLLGFLLAICADWPVGPSVAVCLLGFAIVFRLAKADPRAQAAARWAVIALCAASVLAAPLSLVAGSPDPVASPPSLSGHAEHGAPAPAQPKAAQGHGHSPAPPAAIPTLDPVSVSKVLQHGSKPERLATLTLLGARGQPWALQALLGACLDEDQELREKALSGAALLVEREPDGREALDSYRQHPEPELRLAAAHVLLRTDARRGRQALVRCLSDVELPPFHRLELVSSLRELSGEGFGFDPFAETLEENQAALAAWRAWAETSPIGPVGPTEPSPNEPGLSGAGLSGAGLSGAGPAEGAGHSHAHGQPVPVDPLGSADPRVAERALAALRARGAAAIPDLRKLLENAGPGSIDPGLPAQLLAELDDPAAHAALGANATGADPEAARAVIQALDGKKHRALLLLAADSKWPARRALALRRLSASSDPTLGPLMARGARALDPAAARWLGLYQPALLIETLSQLDPASARALFPTVLPGLLKRARAGDLSELRPQVLALSAAVSAEGPLFERSLPLVLAVWKAPLARQDAAALAAWLQALPSSRRAQVQSSVLLGLSSELLQAPRLRSDLRQALAQGPYFEQGAWAKDPRSGLAAISSSSQSEDLPAALDALAWTAGAPAGPIPQAARDTWRALAAADPALAHNLAVEAWTSPKGDARRARRALALAGCLETLPQPFAAIDEAWPGIARDDLRGHLLAGVERLEVAPARVGPLVAWLSALGTADLPRGLSILTAALQSLSASEALAGALQDGLRAHEASRRAQVLGRALSALDERDLASPALRELRREGLRGPAEAKVLGSFAMRRDQDDLEALLARLPRDLLSPGEKSTQTGRRERTFALLAEGLSASEARAILTHAGPLPRLALARRLHLLPEGLALAAEVWPKLDAECRGAAAKALAQSSNPGATLWLLERAEELDEGSRAALIRRLARAVDPRGLDLVASALEAANPDLRQAAREAIAAYRAQAAARRELRALRQERAAPPDVEQRLLELLADTDPGVVVGAIQGLAGLRSQRALPRFVELLRSSDPQVKSAARRALERFAGDIPTPSQQEKP